MNMNMESININFSQIEIPKAIIDKRCKYVKYGRENNFPLYLIELLEKSGIHNRILTSKVESIIGSGITYDKKKDNKTDLFMNSVNSYETLDELCRKIVWDLELQGGFYLEVIMESGGDKIKELHHVPFNYLRPNVADNRGVISSFTFCMDFLSYKEDQVTISAFDGKRSGILYVKPYTPGNIYFPRPSYIGTVDYIEIDKEIANFHLSHIRNGMNLSQIVSYVGSNPTIEEMATVTKQVKEHFTKTDNTGKVLVNFISDKDNAPIITTPQTNQLDRQFIQLQATTLQNILISHGVTSPMLVGIKTEGQLGGASELENAYKIYDNEILEPHRKIVEDTLNKLGKINGIQPIYFVRKTPIEFQWSEGVLEKILTQDELRERIGYEPIPEPVVEPILDSNIESDVLFINQSDDVEVSDNIDSIDIERQAKARLKGSVGGVQGILQIQKSVSDCITDYDSGLTILDLIYGISELDARRILGINKKQI